MGAALHGRRIPIPYENDRPAANGLKHLLSLCFPSFCSAEGSLWLSAANPRAPSEHLLTQMRRKPGINGPSRRIIYDPEGKSARRWSPVGGSPDELVRQR